MINLTEVRQTLHKNPELSGKEYKTQKYIQEVLFKELNLKGTEVGNTGVIYHFNQNAAKSLLVRVDIDALPILEINEFNHVSRVKGVSHKCGHDGHTTIGIGLVERLFHTPVQNLNISVLFQPAEEIGEGAKAVLSDKNFDVSNYHYAISIHNVPGFELNQIVTKKDSFTPSVQSLILRFEGKTSHAAEPLKGNNPAYCIAELIQWMRSEENTDASSNGFNFITPVHVTVGAPDYGVSAGYGELHLTLRAWEQEKMQEITENVIKKAKKYSELANIGLKIEKLAEFISNNNDHWMVDQINQSVQNLGLSHHTKEQPFSWGEDFGLFTQKIKGAMFGIGAGIDSPALHNPDYDFPDQISKTGVNVFYETAKLIAENGK